MFTTSKQTQVKTAHPALWTATIFYIMVAFEFFYMASPFAIYFYSIYAPGLHFLNQFPSLSWVLGFFLPHIVLETSSPLLNGHNVIGAIIAIFGFLSFCIAASQVYYYKLKKKGAVTRGIYNIIRHPQYTSFALCSFGLLWLWPRFIVLFMFITMLFTYYFLARAEERECQEKFGQSYSEYKNRTHMFLPFWRPFNIKLPSLPKSNMAKVFIILALYFLAIVFSLGLARELQYHTVDSLYTLYEKDSVSISVNKMKTETMEKVVGIAMANTHVQNKRRTAQSSPQTKFLNYIVPAASYISEIPMNNLESNQNNHFFSQSRQSDSNLYKIIFTKAKLRNHQDFQGKELLLNIVTRTPVVEVWVDLAKNQIISVKEPPAIVMYENIPVPIY